MWIVVRNIIFLRFITVTKYKCTRLRERSVTLDHSANETLALM